MRAYQPPGAADELVARIRTAFHGTPYTLIPTRAGFDVTTAIGSPEWHELLYRQKVHQMVIHHVTLDEPRMKISVTDEIFRLEWHVGIGPGGVPIPYLGETLRVETGRV